jgi:hypothetical protein
VRVFRLCFVQQFYTSTVFLRTTSACRLLVIAFADFARVVRGNGKYPGTLRLLDDIADRYGTAVCVFGLRL